MDQNNGLGVRTSKEEPTTIITTDLKVPPIIIKGSLQDQTPHLGITAQTMADHLINAQINHLLETMGIDPEMDPSKIRMETGGLMETFLVLHQIQEETSHKTTPIANQKMINLTTLCSADLTIDLQQTLRPMNRNFRRTILRHHLMWFVSPQPTIP